MLPVAGVFSKREEALRAQNDLWARGVAPEETYLEPVNESFWTNLVDVDVPAEQAPLYEPYVPGSSSMLIVRTSRLSPDEIDRILESHRGLIVRMDVAPPLADLPMSETEER